MITATKMMNEWDIRHYDFHNKIISIRDALTNPTPEIAALGIKVVTDQRLQTAMWQQGLWREFEEDVIQAIDVSSRLGKIEAAARLLAYRAGLNAALGSWRAAIDLAKQALRRTIDPSTQSDALFHLGAASHDLGRCWRARHQLTRALRFAPNNARRMDIKHKLHRVEAALGRKRQSEMLLKEVLDWAERKHRTWFKAELMLDRAAQLRHTDPKAAFDLATESRDIYETLVFKRGIAYSDLEIGRIHIFRRELPEASTALAEARRAFEDADYSPGLAHVHMAFGLLNLSCGKYVDALASFEESLRRARKAGYRRASLRAALYACSCAFRIGRLSRFVVNGAYIARFVSVADIIGFLLSLRAHYYRNSSEFVIPTL